MSDLSNKLESSLEAANKEELLKFIAARIEVVIEAIEQEKIPYALAYLERLRSDMEEPRPSDRLKAMGFCVKDR